MSISITEESSSSPPAKKPLIQASPKSVSTEDSIDDESIKDSSVASVSPANSNSSKSAKRNRGRTISQDGSECENQAPIKLTDELKSILEEDFRQVTKKRKLKGLFVSFHFDEFFPTKSFYRFTIQNQRCFSVRGLCQTLRSHPISHLREATFKDLLHSQP